MGCFPNVRDDRQGLKWYASSFHQVLGLQIHQALLQTGTASAGLGTSSYASISPGLQLVWMSLPAISVSCNALNAAGAVQI